MKKVYETWTSGPISKFSLKTAIPIINSVRFSSVPQSCPTLWEPMDCNTSGFPVHHQLPELAQTHVHGVSDAIIIYYCLWIINYCIRMLSPYNHQLRSFNKCPLADKAASIHRLTLCRESSWRSGPRRAVHPASICSVQSLSHVWLSATPWIAAHQASLSITNSRSSLKFRSIVSVMPSSHLILCHPLLFLPSIPPSIRVFSSESTLRMRWPEYRSFSFSITPSKEHPGLISFRMDWLYLLAVQGTLKSLLQLHSSKASIPHCSALLIVQLSHAGKYSYMTTGKTIGLTRWSFVGKVMSLLICHYFHCFPIYLPWSDGIWCHDLRFLNVEL